MTDRRFRAFVLFAEMRTGSNHLEESLNAIDGIASHGELFNPAFVGAHNRTESHGIDMAARDRDPATLLARVFADTAAGLPGFRYFHDHDPRVLDAILDDLTVAKIVLTRNPLDAYLSWRIAARTDQWRLTNPRMAKAAQVRFDSDGFDRMTAQWDRFRRRVHGTLQRSGQAAFWLSYDQITDLDTLNGIAAFLGAPGRLDAVSTRLKRQNPGRARDKVTNPEEMAAHLARLDPFGLDDAGPVDPMRGPAAPSMIAAAEAPAIALPIPGGPSDAVRDWLARAGRGPARDGLIQKDLRRWMRERPGFVSFAVLPHPLSRAHRVFCRQVLAAKGPKANTLRRLLANQHGVALPDRRQDAWDVAAHRDAFAGFLRFLDKALRGQTSMPLAAEWSTQAAILSGMAQVLLPHRLIREDEAGTQLPALARELGLGDVPWTPQPEVGAHPLSDICDEELQDLARRAYRRDVIQFGFRPWSGPQAA